MEKITKQIVIGVTDDGQCGIQVSPNMDCATAFQLTGTLALHLLNAFYQVAEHEIPETETAKTKLAAKTGIKESMYDAMNSVFSTVLTQFYPDAPKNSIEEEAILALTNKMIEDRYARMPKAERKAFERQYAKMKMRMQLTPHTASHSSTDKGLKHGTDDSSPSESTEA